MSVTVLHGRCENILPTLPDCSVDAVVTDPPYELNFMGKGWDSTGIAYSVEMWAEVLRVLKPGGHLLSFGGSRTWHRMAVAIEDAGFEMRDCITWHFGSGFPKSLDVSKAIDKVNGEGDRLHKFTAWMRTTGLTAAQLNAVTGTFMGSHYLTAGSQPAIPTAELWRQIRPLVADVPPWVDQLVERIEAEREVVGTRKAVPGVAFTSTGPSEIDITAPATPDAARWEGWGTSLKPATEFVTVARKPLAANGINVLKMVESGLRERGVTGVIQWTKRPASAAVKRGPQINSSSIQAPPTEAISAAPADESATASAGAPSASSSAPLMPSGQQPTESTSARTAGSVPPNCGRPSSMHMGESAPAAANRKNHSSRSTTSTEAAPSTESGFTERCTPNSSVRDSRPDIESFAGIATGLTGSRATVRIDRLADGTFAWPDGIPERVPGGPLTVASNVLTWGTGALNVDGCRVGTESTRRLKSGGAGDFPHEDDNWKPRDVWAGSDSGRWPANVILDEFAAAEMDRQSGELTSGKPGDSIRAERSDWSVCYADMAAGSKLTGYGDTGGASRFFYVAKAPKSERPKVNGIAHATVKPLTLIRYLVRLVTPPGGTVLDPFAGSGTTGEACILEGFNSILIEREADHIPLIHHRIDRATDALGLFGEETA